MPRAPATTSAMASAGTVAMPTMIAMRRRRARARRCAAVSLRRRGGVFARPRVRPGLVAAERAFAVGRAVDGFRREDPPARRFDASPEGRLEDAAPAMLRILSGAPEDTLSETRQRARTRAHAASVHS